MEKQLLFYSPNIPMPAVMCQGNKRGENKKLKQSCVAPPAWEPQCESQTFALARCRSNHLPISDLVHSCSDIGLIFLASFFHHISPVRFVPIKMYVPKHDFSFAWKWKPQ